MVYSKNKFKNKDIEVLKEILIENGVATKKEIQDKIKEKRNDRK